MESMQKNESQITGMNATIVARIREELAKFRIFGEMLRDYAEKDRTKLNQKILMRCFLDLAEQQVLKSVYTVSSDGRHVTIPITYSDLLHLLEERSIVKNESPTPTAHRTLQMPKIRPIATRISNACKASEIPLVITAVKHADKFLLKFVIESVPESPKEDRDFDETAYVTNLSKKIDWLVKSSSQNVMTFGRLCKPSITPVSRTDDLFRWSYTDEARDIDDELFSAISPPSKFVVIFGNSGSGTTTSMLYLAGKLCIKHRDSSTPALLPIYLECKPSLFDSLSAELSNLSGLHFVDKTALLEFLRPKAFCLLLDSLADLDISLRDNWLDEVRELMAHCHAGRVILTATFASDPKLAPEQASYELKAVTNPKEFLINHRVSPELAGEAFDTINQIPGCDVLYSPMWLSILASSLREGSRTSIPSGGLIDLLNKLIHERIIPSALDSKAAQRLNLSQLSHYEVTDGLTNLAHAMVTRNTCVDEKEAVTTMAASIIRPTPAESADTARRLFHLLISSNILYRSSEDHIGFHYQEVRDVIAAKRLQESVRKNNNLAEILPLMEWMMADNLIKMFMFDLPAHLQEKCLTMALGVDIGLALRLLLSINPRHRTPSMETELINAVMNIRHDCMAASAKTMFCLRMLASKESMDAFHFFLDELLTVEGKYKGDRGESLAVFALLFLEDELAPISLINPAVLQKHKGISGDLGKSIHRILARAGNQVGHEIHSKFKKQTVRTPAENAASFKATTKMRNSLMKTVEQWSRYLDKLESFDVGNRGLRRPSPGQLLSKLDEILASVKKEPDDLFLHVTHWMHDVLSNASTFADEKQIRLLIKEYVSLMELIDNPRVNSEVINLLSLLRNSHRRRYIGLIPEYCFTFKE